MKNSLNKLVIALAFLLCSDTAIAQIGIGFGTGGFGVGMNIPVNRKNSQRNQRLEDQSRQLKHDLDLSDDQLIKVRGLLIERDRSSHRGRKHAESNEEFDKRMEEILTPEQYSKYTVIKQQKRENRRESKSESKEENKKDSVPESEWDDVYN